MLNDNDIERLMYPVIKRQRDINSYIIRKIAKRIAEIGAVLPSDVGQLERLYQISADVTVINKELARLTGLQVRDIKKIIREVALDSYAEAKPFFDYRHKTQIPFKKNEPIIRAVKAVGELTADTYKNISKAQGFMIRDKKNPKILKPTPIAETYQSIVDEAIQANRSGVDYETAMRRSMEQLAESGIRRVAYEAESGRKFSQRLDTAVRRNLMDGIRAVNLKVWDILGRTLKMDGYELSVHEFSAPDHEPIQGRQFTKNQYEKLNTQKPFRSFTCKGQDVQKFDAIERPIGVWNCRHFAYPIILGVAVPNFTDKELEENKERNQRGYTFPDGKHYTMYECTQHQRELETKIRKEKDKQIMYKEAGNIEEAKKHQAKVNEIMREYKAFSDACGLRMVYRNIRVDGYRKI